mgnify:CR=1 FL=1
MRKEHPRSDSRFAWLTPLPGHTNQTGPWLIVEDYTSQLGQKITDPARKVSCDCLLQMMGDVLEVASETGDQSTHTRWTSSCGSFSVLCMKGTGDDSRLFVQRPEDYFSRMELYVNGKLLAAFQEPVWPHLQQSSPSASKHLSISADCLDALQNGALANRSAIDSLSRSKTIASAA